MRPFLGSLILACFIGVCQSTTCTLTSNTNASCGVVGKVKYGQQPYYATGNSQLVKTLEECAALCARRVYDDGKYHTPPIDDRFAPRDGPYRCQSFEYYEYDNDTTICTIGTVNVQAGVTMEQKSRRTYYDVGCFDCGDRCDQPIGENIIDNGGFEQKLLGPWYLLGGGFGRGRNSPSGYTCLRDYKYFGCSLQQLFNTCPQNLYAFEFDYKVENKDKDDPYESFSLEGLVSGTYYLNKMPNTTHQEWRRVRGAYKGKDGHVVFSREYHTQTQYSIDNLSVARIAVNFSDESVIQNGGFESGNIDPWIKMYPARGTVMVNSPGLRNSTYAVHVRRDVSLYIEQNIPTTPHTLYAFSYDLQVIPGKRGKVDCFIDIYIPNTDTITPGTTVALEKLITKEGFHSVTEYIYVSRSNIALTFSVYCPDKQNADVIYDNLKMVPVEGDAFEFSTK